MQRGNWAIGLVGMLFGVGLLGLAQASSNAAGNVEPEAARPIASQKAAWKFLGGSTRTGTNAYNRFEYAEFTILPDRAVISGDTTIQEIVPPRRVDDRDTVFENDAGRYTLRFDLRLYYLNLVGSEGWQLLSSSPVEPGKVYLLVRERQ